MLCQSDHAYVVVDEKMNRSMKAFLAGGPIELSQIIDLNPQALAKNCHNGLPVQSLASLLEKLKTGSINAVIDASTSISAQMLSTKMRDSNLQGPSLQRVHVDVGKLLADKLIDKFGRTMELVESIQISHVQGGHVEGVASCSTNNIIILPLMRGGEPMARGVYDRFPTSSFIHFYDGEDEIDKKNGLFVKTLENFVDSSKPVVIILVDSVINTGMSIQRSIHSIYKAAKKVNSQLELVLYVLSGVMQEEAAKHLPCQFLRVRFLTLRLSKNKYTGKGTSDTGNRLFGTTLIE